MSIWLRKHMKDQWVSLLLIQPQMPGFISNRFSHPRHLTKHSIRGEGSIHPDILRQNHEISLRYLCLWQSFMLIYWRRS